MKTAWLYLRHKTDERFRIFSHGLRKHGYSIQSGLPQNYGKNDLFVTWNRLPAANATANEFESRGMRVLVAENSSWGNEFNGDRWFHIARNLHNTAGMFDYFDDTRWDDLQVNLEDFRSVGEGIILPQRGIGPINVRMPPGWAEKMKKQHGYRIRKHPGRNKSATPLEKDLDGVSHALTWGSGAAIKALMIGVKIYHFMPDWIGKQDNTTHGRLDMFRRLACAQWTHKEIENGFAFERLL